MRVLIGCESSGTVRDAFAARGHEALSCDLLPTDSPGPHYQGDVVARLLAGQDQTAEQVCVALFVARADAEKVLRELHKQGAVYRRFTPDKQTGWPAWTYSCLSYQFRKPPMKDAPSGLLNLLGDCDASIGRGRMKGP